MKKCIFWHRRDLRLNDNAGLYHALKSGSVVQAIFIFDKHILDKLEDKSDARVQFIHQEVRRLDLELQALGSALQVYYGDPVEILNSILEKDQIEAVYTNRDY